MKSETSTYSYDVGRMPEDKYRKMQAADLQLAINSPTGEDTKWVLVEGRMDRDFYPLMFADDVRIYIAGYVSNEEEPDNVHGGVKAVREVVTKILKDGYTTNIIGIIDRDYYEYRAEGDETGADHTGHIFKTDYRDLEMTLFTLSSAWSAITSLPEFSTTIYSDWELVIRHLGAIRVANRHCSVYEHFDISVGNLFDCHTRALVPDWQEIAWSMAQKECSKSLEKSMLTIVENRFHLSTSHMASYARGHDAFKLLAIMLLKDYTEKKLVELMINHCSFEDCKSLQLYRDIAAWETTHVKMLRSA